MKTIITLQRNMDNGYGTVYCVQKQDFELSNIHSYFETNEPFDSVESLVIYLEDKLENDESDFLNEPKLSLPKISEAETKGIVFSLKTITSLPLTFLMFSGLIVRVSLTAFKGIANVSPSTVIIKA